MTRKQKLLTNTGASLLRQLIALLCGFILPKYMMMYFGSDVNGLASSIAHFLSFISLLDMGVGAVVQANLYKPLADNDTSKISLVVASSQRFFRRLAYIFLVYIAVLSFIYPLFLNTEFDTLYSASLIFIIAASTFAQYFIGMPYQLLLNADQKTYVHEIMQISTIILNTVGSVVLMRLGASVHIVKLLSATVFVLRPIGQMIYVKAHYKLDRKIKIEGEPIKQKWNGFSQHLSSVVCANVDVVALTVFSTMQNVSVYSVYHTVVAGVTNVVMAAASGLESLFGNMIAKEEKDKLLHFFEMVEWLVHTVVILLFTVAAIVITPFIAVYTKEITDVSYYAPVFGLLLVFAYSAQCLRIPYFRIIKAAGHFKQSQNGAYIAAIINIIITLALVFKFGLIGAAIGTFVAMLYHTCYFAWYLRKNIINRPIKHFLIHMLTDAIIIVLSIVFTNTFELKDVSYVHWGVYALKVFAVTLGVSAIVNVVFFGKKIKKVLDILKNKKTKRNDV